MVAIPGPSTIPDEVLSAMHRPMPNIYEGELIDTSVSVLEDLPALARTESEGFVTISNGHGAWEMALTNTLSRGEKILVLESGVFAHVWGRMASTLGLEVETVPGTARGPVDPEAVESKLVADIDHAIKAVLVVHVDTASSVRNDIAALRRALDAARHPALLMVDGIASLCCDRFEMDEWGVDVTVAGSQKGIMVPPGLGFVWANPKARAAYERADLRTGYWDWGPRSGPGVHYLKYCGTPPIQHLYALRTAIDLLMEEGLENVWWRHQVLADAIRSAVEAWGAPGGIELNIESPAHRSNAVTTVLTGGIDAAEIRRRADREAGLVLGIPLGEFEGRAFRIGHMGHQNPPMVLGVLATIEAVLHSLGAPIGGSGAAAAARLLGEHLHVPETPGGADSGRS